MNWDQREHQHSGRLYQTLGKTLIWGPYSSLAKSLDRLNKANLRLLYLLHDGHLRNHLETVVGLLQGYIRILLEVIIRGAQGLLSKYYWNVNLWTF